MSYICSPKTREFSSAGSEHLPYKQRVTGSNPVTPTILKGLFLMKKAFFCTYNFLQRLYCTTKQVKHLVQLKHFSPQKTLKTPSKRPLLTLF